MKAGAKVRRLLDLSLQYKANTAKVKKLDKRLNKIANEAGKLAKTLGKDDRAFYAERLKKSIW